MFDILPAAPLGTTDQMSPTRAAGPIDRVLVGERDKSRDLVTKASLVLAGAGFFIAVIFTELLTGQYWAAGLLPALFTVATFWTALAALQPVGVRQVTYSRSRVETVLAMKKDFYDLRKELLLIKADEVEARVKGNQARASSLRLANAFLASAAAVTLIVLVTIGLQR